MLLICLIHGLPYSTTTSKVGFFIIIQREVCLEVELMYFEDDIESHSKVETLAALSSYPI